MRVFIACSSSNQVSREYISLTNDILSLLKEYNIKVITGGISLFGSMMYAVYDKFKDNIHIYPVEKYKNELSDINPDSYDIVSSTIDRLKMIYNNSDIFLILPSGTGTLSELFGILEELRTNESDKKLIIYNYNNYYDEILNLIDRYIEDKFSTTNIKDNIKVVKNINELKKIMEEI